MDQRLTDFINTYLGIPNVGDTPQNKGQCVGLIEVWTDSLGLPHTWGNAKDLLADADPNSFEIIYNTPTNFPIPGDIFVCGASWGGGDGHTGIIKVADVNSWTAFEENNPVGHAPQILTHYNYNGMLGWLRPKVNFPPPPAPDPLPEPNPGYPPTFEGMTVVKDGIQYKSYKDGATGKLLWKIEVPQPQPTLIPPVPTPTPDPIPAPTPAPIPDPTPEPIPTPPAPTPTPAPKPPKPPVHKPNLLDIIVAWFKKHFPVKN